MAVNIPDLSGKIALVTGGNAGIGSMICQILAAHGAKVYMGARSEEKANAAIAKIENDVPSLKGKNQVLWHYLELDEPKDVIKSADAFKERESRLDMLINNAAMLGISLPKPVHTIPLPVLVAHVGHFVLTRELLPLLEKTAALPNSDVRIVQMGSQAHAMCPDINMLETIEQLSNPWPDYQTPSDGYLDRCKRYFYTKVLNELYKIGLKKRLLERPESNSILIMTTNPGFVQTENSLATQPWWSKLACNLLGHGLEVGARSAVFAAASPVPRKEFERYNGAFLHHTTKIREPSEQARDPVRAENLWRVTEEAVDKILKNEI